MDLGGGNDRHQRTEILAQKWQTHQLPGLKVLDANVRHRQTQISLASHISTFPRGAATQRVARRSDQECFLASQFDMPTPDGMALRIMASVDPKVLIGRHIRPWNLPLFADDMEGWSRMACGNRGGQPSEEKTPLRRRCSGEVDERLGVS